MYQVVIYMYIVHSLVFYFYLANGLKCIFPLYFCVYRCPWSVLDWSKSRNQCQGRFIGRRQAQMQLHPSGARSISTQHYLEWSPASRRTLQSQRDRNILSPEGLGDRGRSQRGNSGKAHGYRHRHQKSGTGWVSLNISIVWYKSFWKKKSFGYFGIMIATWIKVMQQ